LKALEEPITELKAFFADAPFFYADPKADSQPHNDSENGEDVIGDVILSVEGQMIPYPDGCYDQTQE
jgi:hypothetical protein